MAVGFAGIGSGANWSTLISQLVQIESKTLTSLRSRETQLENQVTDYGAARSAVDAFKTVMDGFRDDSSLDFFSGATSDDSVLTAGADSSAATSSYSVVVSQLASNDKIGSSVYTDSNTAVGTGTLSFTVDGQTSNITVDGTNNTLSGLRNAINNASDNPGITASIINETGGSRLILTGNETGSANAITIGVSDGDDGINNDAAGLSKLSHIGAGNDGVAEQISTAANTKMTIEGFDVESASNKVTGAITGVTLNIASLGSATIDIAKDTSKIEEKVQSFVDAYNNLTDKFEVLDISSLAGDSGLRSMEQAFVEVLNQSATVGGSNAYLFELGVTRDKLGKLSLDSSELSSALTADFDRVSKIFSDDATGYGTRFYNLADQILDDIVPSRQESLKSQQRLLDTRIEREEIHLDVYEKTLVERFAALDTTVSALQTTGSYLAGQLNALMG